MPLHLYTFEEKDGTESSFSTQNFEEASTFAQKYRMKLIDNTYEFEDSELVEDYTLTDEDTEQDGENQDQSEGADDAEG
jgi:hypothetical protein